MKSAYERGYITRDEAMRQLVNLAAHIGSVRDGQLVKIAVQVHTTPDDGSAVDGEAITEKTVSLKVGISDDHH